MHAGEEDHARPGWTTSIRGQDSRGRVSENDRRQRSMEKVRPWCGQPSDRGRLNNQTEPQPAVNFQLFYRHQSIYQYWAVEEQECI